MVSDFWPHGVVAEKYGVLRSEGFSERAIFIIDRQGAIQYIDIHDIDQQPDNEELFKVLRKLEPLAASREALEKPAPAVELPRGGIVMYCTRWCPDCRKARVWFEENHLEYIEIDITTNRTAAAQVRKWANGNETTPTFDIDGEIVVNYDLPRLKELLKDRLK